jgi:hypothetical protein
MYRDARRNGDVPGNVWQLVSCLLRRKLEADTIRHKPLPGPRSGHGSRATPALNQAPASFRQSTHTAVKGRPCHRQKISQQRPCLLRWPDIHRRSWPRTGRLVYYLPRWKLAVTLLSFAKFACERPAFSVARERLARERLLDLLQPPPGRGGRSMRLPGRVGPGRSGSVSRPSLTVPVWASPGRAGPERAGWCRAG